MSDRKFELRMDLKFLVKLGKSATESIRLLTDVYEKDVMIDQSVFVRKLMSQGTMLMVFFYIKST